MDVEDPLVRQAQRRLGTVLCGKYTVDRILGIGGMAVVYAATHRNQKQVAIKMLHAELSLHTEIKKRFLREGYVANSVKHRGAVDVIDDDQAEDGAAFIVMEYLEGAPVDKIVSDRGGRIPAKEAIVIAYELCSVLAAAHDRGIVHRDIKPANLFITNDGELKVLDFGIARLRDSSATAQHTSTGMMMGTPAFMSPEQARGKATEIGPPTDIWAVGASLFSMLSAKTVHEAETMQLAVIQVATEQARSLATVDPAIPAELVQVVDTALAFDAANRWKTAAAMRSALRDVHAKLFGPMKSSATLATLVGAEIRGGSERPPPVDDIAMAATNLAPTPATPISVRSPEKVGLSTVEPVSSTAFVAPLATKRSLAIGGAVLGVVGVIGALGFALSRSPKDTAPPARLVIDSPTPSAASAVVPPSPTQSAQPATTVATPDPMPSASALPKPATMGMTTPRPTTVVPRDAKSAQAAASASVKVQVKPPPPPTIDPGSVR